MMNFAAAEWAGAELSGPPLKIDPLGRMDRRNAAVALNKSEQTLANWKTKGIGPRCFLVNGIAYYDAREVYAFGRGEAA